MRIILKICDSESGELKKTCCQHGLCIFQWFVSCHGISPDVSWFFLLKNLFWGVLCDISGPKWGVILKANTCSVIANDHNIRQQSGRKKESEFRRNSRWNDLLSNTPSSFGAWSVKTENTQQWWVSQAQDFFFFHIQDAPYRPWREGKPQAQVRLWGRNGDRTEGSGM